MIGWKPETKERKTKMKTLICAFCENVYSAGTSYCSNCVEYKGIMTIEAFDRIYGTGVK